MEPLKPSLIKVTEKYVYESKITGIRTSRPDSRSGLIQVTIPYDRRRHSSQPQAHYGIISQSLDGLLHDLKFHSSRIGALHIDNYGRNDLYSHPEVNLVGNTLPLIPELTLEELDKAKVHDRVRFDLSMTHEYKPDKSIDISIVTSAEVKDEKNIKLDQQKIRKLDLEQLTRFCEEAGLLQSLVICLQVSISLPNHLRLHLKNKRPVISRMNLSWPVATPYRTASLSFEGNEEEPVGLSSVLYDPEQDLITWLNVRLNQVSLSESEKHSFISEPVYLRVNDPGELFQKSKLKGEVIVEAQGICSKLSLSYPGLRSNIQYRTIIKDKFLLDLAEGFRDRVSSPAQRLQFPGVILNEARVFNIVMLLQDQGFQVKEPEPIVEGPNGIRQSLIQAIRDEGAKQLSIFILMRGTRASTTRRRSAEGKAKYTTDLPTGDTTIYILGQTQRDSKRIVNVVNEIQVQLKEQFHHVSSAE